MSNSKSQYQYHNQSPQSVKTTITTKNQSRGRHRSSSPSLIKTSIILAFICCSIILIFQIYFHSQLDIHFDEATSVNDDLFSVIRDDLNTRSKEVKIGTTKEKVVNDKTSQRAAGNSNSNSTSSTVTKSLTNCGCPSTCTSEVLSRGNDHFTCQTRIQKLMNRYNMEENQACEMASKSSIDEVDKDGLKPCPMECNPKQCHNHTVPKKTGIDCGCPYSCDKRALHKRNPSFMCIDRIEHLIKKKNLPELEACASASQTTYNYNDTDNIDINKPCEYECHPQICKHMTSRPTFQNITNVNLPKESFIKYDKVVIVTKVLSAGSIDLLIQMLCLLNTAYNRFVHYDIIVFTTIPFTQGDIEKVQQIALPAKLQVVTEGKSLSEHLAEMTPEEINHLNKRCNVKENEIITWDHHCTEDDTPHVFSLGYAWQAEFRSYHLWTHEALKPYKYMMWLDADAMCTKTWDYDPMKVMVENDLILMYDQFPGGYVRGEVLKQKMMKAYDKVVCKIDLNSDRGILTTEYCTDEKQPPSIRQVYGFHHITNLDIYRKEVHQKFLKELINNGYRFSRLWDDQLAVTLPAVMEDPSRCWDYRINGLHMGIHHSGRIDGKEHPKYLSYLNFWANTGKYDWPAARAMCDGLVTVIS